MTELLPCKPVFAAEQDSHQASHHTKHMLIVSPSISDDGDCLVCQASLGHDSDIIHGDVFRCLWCSRLVHEACMPDLKG